jgi:hypothetical protein
MINSMLNHVALRPRLPNSMLNMCLGMLPKLKSWFGVVYNIEPGGGRDGRQSVFCQCSTELCNIGWNGLKGFVQGLFLLYFYKNYWLHGRVIKLFVQRYRDVFAEVVSIDPHFHKSTPLVSEFQKTFSGISDTVLDFRIKILTVIYVYTFNVTTTAIFMFCN